MWLTMWLEAMERNKLHLDWKYVGPPKDGLFIDVSMSLFVQTNLWILSDEW